MNATLRQNSCRNHEADENLPRYARIRDYRPMKQKARSTDQSYQTIRSAVRTRNPCAPIYKGRGIGVAIIIR